MTEEIPSQSEREAIPEYQLFNLDAMTDEQIAITGRAYLAESDRVIKRGNPEAVDAVQEILNQLSDDFVRLMRCSPDRARNLISGLVVGATDEEHRYDRELAITWAAHTAPVDYEFAKRTILSLRDTDAADLIYDQISIGSYLTPEQYADFEDAWGF